MVRWERGLPVLILLVLASLIPSDVYARDAIPFETIAPIVAATDARHIQTISIAGEGATGIVMIGSGLLGGTEPIRDPDGGTALSLLARNDDGSWRTIQTTSVSGAAEEPVVLDLDGDGLEDVVATSWNEGITSGLSYFRQTPEGRLLPPSEIDLPDSLIVYHMARAGADGRLIVLGRVRSMWSLRAAELNWSADEGLRLLWQRTYSMPDSNMFRPIAWLPRGDSGVALVAENAGGDSYMAFHSLRLDDGAWLDSNLPRSAALDGVFATERRDGIQRWMWGRADSIYRLDTDADGRIVPFAIPVRDFPAGWYGDYGGIPSRCVAAGDPPVIAKVGGLDTSREPQIGFIELTNDGGARWIDRWQHAPDAPYGAPLTGVLERPDGSLATLHDASGAICEFHGPGNAPPVDVPYAMMFGRVYEDLTGDGVRDLFGSTRTLSGLSLQFFRGIPHPPWFLTPVPVSIDWNLTDKEVADVDGDGTADLVCVVSQDSSTAVVILSFDGETLRPWSEGPVQIGRGSVLAADFDGNGRSEVLTEDVWASRDHRLLSWGTDRTLASSAPMNGLIFNALGTGDFDGDGREEILGWHYADFEVLRCNSGTEKIDTLWRIRSGLKTLYDAIVGDMDADPFVEAVWSDFDATQVWSSDGPGGQPQAQTIAGLLGVGEIGYLGITDWNADGAREIVYSTDGVLMTAWNPLVPGATREEVRVLPDLMAGVDSVEPAIADVDGDGDPDLVIFRGDGIRVERNLTIEGSATPFGSALLRITGPNPSRDRIHAAFRILSGGTSARIELLDVTGRSVWQTERPVSRNTWIPVDVPEDRMRRLAAGVYWLQVRAGDQSGRAQIVIVR